MFRCSFSAFRPGSRGYLFQPNQSELDCGHSAGQLQRHLQSVPQHGQRREQNEKDRAEGE